MDKYFYQHCKDEKVIEAFRELHINLVNKVIIFCKEHNIDIDELSLNANGLKTSIKEGYWTPATDSCFIIEKNVYSELRKNPLDVTNEEYEEAKFKHLPYLYSI